MVERIAGKGVHAGSRFWGCSRFPKCRRTVPISSSAISVSEKPISSKEAAATSMESAGPLSAEDDTNQFAPDAAAEPEHRLLDYYIACIEAEGRRELTLPRGSLGSRFVLLESGPERVIESPAGDWRTISSKSQVVSFAQVSGMSDNGEKALYGFPLISGYRDGAAVLAPLFYAEVEMRVRADGDAVEVRPLSNAIELSGVALEILGLPRAERKEIVQALDASNEEAFDVRWRTLEAYGLVNESHGQGQDLVSIDWARKDVQRAAALFAGERAVVTRQLLEDLEELRQKPVKVLRQGPLGVVLRREIVVKGWPDVRPQPVVVPTNFSQDQAITAALETDFTVVTGPPGTGKSQVLVNTVAAALERGQSVLFASKNNQAVDVVFQRLASISPEAAPLRAGNKSKRIEMGQQMLDALNRGATPPERNLSGGESWARKASELDELYQKQALRSQVERRLNSLADACEDALDEVPLSLRTLEDPRPIALALLELEAVLAELRRKPLFWWLGRRRRRRLQERADGDWSALKAKLPQPYARTLPDIAPDSFERFFAELGTVTQFMSALAERQVVEGELRALPDRETSASLLHVVESDRVHAARTLFESNWIRRVRRAGTAERTSVSTFANALLGNSGQPFGRDALAKLAPDVIKVFPIWGVTNLSARASVPLVQGLFDLLIVDEASQCDIPSALPLLFRAKRAMVIGDSRQLVHVASLRAKQDAEIARQHGVDEATFLDMNYSTVSLFDVSTRRVGEQPLFLDEHYRSREAIIRFSNDLFYGSRLVIRTPEADTSEGSAVSWIEARGLMGRGRGGKSAVNESEARAVVETIGRLLEDAQGSGISIGVVTPFAAHAERVRELLADPSDALVVATAHRFQGDERHTIIFSPVLSGQAPDHLRMFVNDANLINVAVTRARRRLIIVGDRRACLASGGVLGQLAQYSVDLEEGRFDSPLERKMFLALEDAGFEPKTGMVVDGYRLDLGVVADGVQLDVECDGAIYHRDIRKDNIRDAALRDAGWRVLRLSGRDINSDPAACIARVRQSLRPS